MDHLSITLIDVGWGDSIFIESKQNNEFFYALIDSNDTTYNRSSYLYLKKYFERNNPNVLKTKNIFDFVMLSHAHTDHGQGIKSLLKEFGTYYFWYPKSINWSSLSNLIDYCNRSTKVKSHQSIDSTKVIPNLGSAEIDILWPDYGKIDSVNENNNSIVFSIKIGNVSFVLTGDAEEDVWNNISNRIPQTTKFFKMPHHGSNNGAFDRHGNAIWYVNCPNDTVFGISSHVRPFSHPDINVVNYFDSRNRKYYRTDEQYHLTFTTDGQNIDVKYSHLES